MIDDDCVDGRNDVVNHGDVTRLAMCRSLLFAE